MGAKGRNDAPGRTIAELSPFKSCRSLTGRYSLRCNELLSAVMPACMVFILQQKRKLERAAFEV